MKLPRHPAAAAAAGLMLLSLTACGGAAAGSAEEDGPIGDLRYLVPNAAGSGWDTTARTAAETLESAKLIENAEVFNVDGANGTVGLARLVNEAGNAEMVMQMGLGLVAAVNTQNSDVTLEDTTPIARLVEEYEIIVVPNDSPYQDLSDLIEAWEKDPSLPIGGGSAPGGADHITPMLVAEAVGIEPRETNYVSFGGSEVLPAVLGGQVAFAVTGAGDAVEQVNAGQLRALAVSGDERIDTLPDVPTLAEGGVDVTFSNWRGVVAPPELSDAEVQRLVEMFDAMVETEEWAAALERNGWADAYLAGDEYASFLAEQDAEVGGVLSDLGL